MAQFRSDFLRLLETRGYIHQITDAEALDKRASEGIITAYIGFDPTAPSLHVGSLLQIMMLRRLQQSGHKPVVLMGGGTGKIGDPSFKDEARQLLNDDTIKNNVASIRRVFEHFLHFGNGPTDAVMVNNAEWLDRLEYIPFLRDVGRHFSVNRMLSFDSVKLRLDREQSLSFLEFNYMILQAYDFLELSRRLDVTLQLGGSDQWGNIVNGIELARRMDSKEVFGLTSPLMTTADGVKMGKTVGGAVWLNGDMCSPYDYWQFWRNTHDADVERFLKLFTDLSLDEIAKLSALEGSEINEAKKILANEATKMAHGEKAALEAAETAKRTFEEGVAGDALPVMTISKTEISLIDALVGLNLVSSKAEARRMIRGGGARIDGEKALDEKAIITVGAEAVRISAGKKAHGVLQLER
ncbi:MAG: tyrosine--tRNA ligase [Zymomonas mobilis subsp. pomaceae]|uniref:Tyrosine--tRNA ligase n=1 Tax=Zymomonas mobilis subsp. pomaceae (strain ATCC 29192 / DSM 22645 / JCM 10191 / CCUG 17912 / NBRC 13757 / NCIMB 11200 / NRRL B-4491 / Barker I) TaxID=579138 RepID=F8EVM4_ZYMMT|nr:tyrosine--tRNA ligase [Zymomonas mobilis]AEI38361.1 tyrosyl-tRNA synthetase [Zymomonas mobilis subsp. pomaceae ATCC 29192]MDX5948050.1 tyrosine--tRNA ligase [Zymomonas mobilis subsp. pomaceae]GEB89380.1 tyrosine--tRNA ligase [Zymomonas mobilis subsp. pomaceae]